MDRARAGAVAAGPTVPGRDSSRLRDDEKTLSVWDLTSGWRVFGRPVTRTLARRSSGHRVEQDGWTMRSSRPTAAGWPSGSSRPAR